jgi:hypothetical protein
MALLYVIPETGGVGARKDDAVLKYVSLNIQIVATSRGRTPEKKVTIYLTIDGSATT